MSELRSSLLELAERGTPRPVEEVADEVVRRLAYTAPTRSLLRPRPPARRTPLVVLAGAAAVVVLTASVAVLVSRDDSRVDVDVATGPTTPTAQPGGWRRVDPASLPQMPNFVLSSVATAGQVIVAGGWSNEDNSHTAAIVVSADGGRTWDAADGDLSAAGHRVVDVVVVPDGFVAVGNSVSGTAADDVVVWRSADGRTWSRVDATALRDGRSAIVRGAAARGSVILAAGSVEVAPSSYDAAVWRSDDGGRTWRRLRHEGLEGDRHQFAYDVVAAGSGFLLAGAEADPARENGGAMTWFSRDGEQWARIVVRDAPPQSAMTAAAAGGPGFVAVGGATQTAAAWTSRDGFGWDRVPHDDMVFGSPRSGRITTIMSVAADADGGLIAVGLDGPGPGAPGPVDGRVGIWLSPDGVRWTRDTTASTGSMRPMAEDVAIGPAGAVIVGYTERSGGPGDPTVLTPMIWLRR